MWLKRVCESLAKVCACMFVCERGFVRMGGKKKRVIVCLSVCVCGE